MKKHFLTAAIAAFLAFPTFGTPLAAAESPEAAAQAQQQAAEDRATLIDSKIAAVKAGLKLTPAQEKDWASLETALREVASARATRKMALAEKGAEYAEKDDVIQGLKLGAKDLQARGEDMQKVAEAATPLFESMDAAQKHRFALLLRTYTRK